MPKFKIGDYVWITHTANRQLFKITARQGTYYRLKGSRWWEEDRLVLATPAQIVKKKKYESEGVDDEQV